MPVHRKKKTRKKILIADDDPSILESMKMLLELYGYDVEITPDGDTLYAMDTKYPDVLLLDICMSGEDGREICRYLKKRNKTKHIPVILISANKELLTSELAEIADDRITKPFDVPELISKISKYADS